MSARGWLLARLVLTPMDVEARRDRGEGSRARIGARATSVFVASLVALVMGAGCDGLIGSEHQSGPEADGGAASAPKADDADPQPPVGDTPPPQPQSDGGVPLPPAPGSVSVNVGINRGVVPGYSGDTCGSVASLLVIEAAAPGGASLGRQELDCQRGGYNGWTWFDRAPGTYTATVQLFSVDASGARSAATPPRVVRGDLRAGEGVVLWADFTYQDFAYAFSGSLKWQTGWVSATQPGVEHGCEGAAPSVAQQRITVRDDTGAVVVGWARGPDGFVRTDGSEPGACSNFAASEAQVVPELRWGVYTVTVEGLDAAGQVAYCARRPLFTPNGEGVIFHVTATAGPCS